jgi:ATP-binding cassette subfamily B (MDR/TAP) protein 1
MAAAARMFAVVDEAYDSIDPLSDDGSCPSSLTGSVDFKSCGFTYPTRPGHPVFYASDGRDGLSLSIPPKKSVGFVGKSGCGKSSALQLLLRFYDVSSGHIAVDDNNIQELNIRWLRSNIGYVGQQPVLFAGTVRENILLGKLHAT